MCGRYARRSDKQKIAEFFAVHGPFMPTFQDEALNTSPTMRLRLQFVSAVDGSLQATAGKPPYFRRLVVTSGDMAGPESFTSRNPRWLVLVLGSPFPRPPGM
jgi:hypothetical protein